MATFGTELLTMTLGTVATDTCVCGSARPYAGCCGTHGSQDDAVPSLYAQAIRLHQGGRVAEAMQVYEQILAKAPDHPGALYYLGAAHLEMDDARAALPYLRRALELRPERDANAWFALGLAAFTVGDYAQAVDAYRRSLQMDPSQIAIRNNLAVALGKLGRTDEAKRELASGDGEAANLSQTVNLANLLIEQGREDEAEEHYRRALAERPDDLVVLHNYAVLLNRQRRHQEALAVLDSLDKIFKEFAAEYYRSRGRTLHNLHRLDEAAAAFGKVPEFDPDHFNTYAAWAALEEERHNLDLAAELAGKALAIAPDHPENVSSSVILAKYHRRKKEPQRALELLRGVDIERASLGARAGYHFELGTILDALGDYDAAFEAYALGNQEQLEVTQHRYDPARNRDLAERLITFFTRERMQAMGQLSPPPSANLPRPIFIVGFPRSGTTLVEQILGVHPEITAGDELPYLSEIASGACTVLGSQQGYPDCLTDIARPQHHDALRGFRDYYLHHAGNRGLPAKDKRLFTDKMPLNEWHLGLVRLIFPDSPVIHVVRHPLDSCLSSHFQNLVHGDYCAYHLETAAQHYALTYRLAEHYRQQLGLRFLRVRYEDLVDDFESNVRKLLEFVGVPFDERCLAFHESKRVARTASYAQVTQKLYKTSQYRYRHYRRHVEPMIPILEPVIRELGYEVEGPLA